MSEWNYYLDFKDNKIHKTKGKYIGIVGHNYVGTPLYGFERKSDLLLIPEYCLRGNSRDLIRKEV